MNHHPIITLLLFYGAFLILCGVMSLIFIGKKAKTALASGGLSGLISFFAAYLHYQQSTAAYPLGLFLSGALFIVFSWRLSKTLSLIFTLIPKAHQDLPGKGTAFLIIGLMAIVSIFVFVLQLLFIAMIAV